MNLSSWPRKNLRRANPTAFRHLTPDGRRWVAIAAAKGFRGETSSANPVRPASCYVKVAAISAARGQSAAWRLSEFV